METYFTSDWHFGHYTNKERGVIQFCGRPWPAKMGTPEMNRDLIKGFRGLTYEDTLYNLGDCWFRTDEEYATRIMNQIHCGNKVLITGNHDKWGKAKFGRTGWDRVTNHWDLLIDGIKVLLVHDPVVACVEQYKEHVILCGHVHQLWKTFGRCINVGVDVWDFKPVSLTTLRPLIAEAAEQNWEEYHDNVQRKNYRSGGRSK